MKCSRKNILLPNVTYVRNTQKEFEYDASLPEFLPNINRPVKVDAKAIPESVIVNDGKIEILGKIIYCFLYVSDYMDSLKYTEYEDSFSIQSEITDATKNSIVSPLITCAGLSCKMLNPRKFILKSKFDISYTINNLKQYSIIDEKSEGCFFKTDTIKCFTKIPIIEREFCFTDKYDIGDSFKPINEIISKNIYISPSEYSTGDGYINIKASANIKMLCISDEKSSEIFCVTRNIPLTFIIEDSEISSDSICSIDIIPASVTTDVGIDAYGENKTINIKLCVKASVHCYNPEIITIASDVFSPNSSNIQKQADLQFNKLIDTEKKMFTIEKLLETSETEFSKIYETSATLNITKSEIADKETIFNGTAVVSILGETNNGIDLFDIMVDFSERLPAIDITDIQIKPIEIFATAVGNSNIALKIISSAEYLKSINESRYAVESCEFTDIPVESNAPVLLIYYSELNDDLWTIAKKYGIAPEYLKTKNPNRFDGDKITDNNLIVIPRRV
ncbi:MAG: hypothetical protein A2Y17_02765 [Clostridiales bacterium GWF2_38_85]|nr:MAG: hypothetical protein A2Y17_02765 [Clostridiales bacterium GWF2_38_85]